MKTAKDLFSRSENNPILKAEKNHSWENLKVYNPGVFYEDGKYHLFYRAIGKSENSLSSIGYAVSEEGVHFERNPSSLLEPDPQNKLESKGYEDPRITKVGNTYFMTYAVFDGVEPLLNIATSTDLKKWEKRGQALDNFRFSKMGGVYANKPGHEPQYNQEIRGKDEWAKAGGIFPEKIMGKYWMLFNSQRIWFAQSDNGIDWKAIPKPFIKPRSGDYFDNFIVGMGPPPIKTDLGWLVIYHGVDKQMYYRLGLLLLDLKNPEKIIARSSKTVFEPSTPYELGGKADNVPGWPKKKVIYCCGAVVVDGVLRIYYGASDTFICTATAKLEDILKTLH